MCRRDSLSEMGARVDVAARRKYYGDFVLEGDASFAEVCAAYGCEVPVELSGLTLGEAMRRRAPRIVEGDSVQIARLLLVAREVAGGRVVKVCLLYTSDAADERSSGDLGGRRVI